MSTTFELCILGWTSQVSGSQLPICQILSSIQISSARIESVLYTSQILKSARTLNGQYVTSTILWSDARVYAKVGAIDLILLNFGDFIGCFLYSMLSDFSVGPLRAENEQGIFHAFVRIDDNKVIFIVKT